jgi:peptidoglycan hydrolase-like protein with peptidoglycan-binding domain
MPNPGQPTVSAGSKGDVVKRAQRAVRRGYEEPGLVVDGVFGPNTEREVRGFQTEHDLQVDGVVGPATWEALPDGGPMPTLREGESGDIVRSLQERLGEGEWGAGLGTVDGQFGPKTRAAVEALQKFGNVAVDGVVGEQTWDIALGFGHHSLETVVGLQYAVG